ARSRNPPPPAGRSTIARSSADSGVFRTAIACWAAIPRPRSNNGWTTAAFRADGATVSTAVDPFDSPFLIDMHIEAVGPVVSRHGRIGRNEPCAGRKGCPVEFIGLRAYRGQMLQ